MQQALTTILFVGHGTRRQTGIAECLQFTRAVEEQIKSSCCLDGRDEAHRFDTCFLELHPYSIESAVKAAVKAGSTTIYVVPLLLFSAGHHKTDIPEALTRAAKEAVSDVRIVYLDALHAENTLVDLVAARIRAAINENPTRGRAAIVVTRGNRDADAYKELQTLSSKVAEKVGFPVAHASLVGLGPRMETALDDLAREHSKEVIVVPYLLFKGLLLKQIPLDVSRWQLERQSALTVSVTPHLGLNSALIHRLAERILQTCRRQNLS